MTTPETLIQATSRFYSVPVSEMIGRKRDRSIVRARHIAMYVLAQETEMSYVEISRIFKRDHSSVSHAQSSMENQIQRYGYLKSDIEKILLMARSAMYADARGRAAAFGTH